ncbi:MAG: hypothetical protein JNL11_18970 [Bdellovibrionaceae bacterium]|nr:hypothetical protein [Pseudobdellovibrionaceae bacterium]
MDIFAFVLEDEPKLQTQIFKALRKINPQVKVRFFRTLEEFSAWIALFVKDGISVIENAGFRLEEDTDIESISSEKVIRLLVCKAETLGSRSVSLVAKSVELFIRKNACTTEEKTSVVLTAFDREDFDIKSMESPFINNVIFKPFDSLILEEHMRFAFVGRKKPSEENFKSNKLEAQVEMVKDIPCAGFSDLGFITLSDRELRTGEVSKFYSDEFASDTLRSVMAKCVKSIARTGRNETGYLCWMEYFGLDEGQIKKFRKELVNEFPASHMNARINDFKKNILIMEPVDGEELASSMRRFFPQSFAFSYSSWERFSFDAAPESTDFLVEKDIPVSFNFSIYLDSTGRYFLNHEPYSESDLVFGEIFKDLKRKDWHHVLTAESKKTWLEVFNVKNVERGKEPILTIENVGKVFFVRLTQLKRIQNEGQMPQIQIVLSALSLAEKIAFLKSKSPLPSRVDVVVASEYFMNKILEGGLYQNAKRILVTEKQISDKEKKRWAPLVHDVFTNPIDRNYLVKKIYLSFLEKFAWTVKHFNTTQKDIQSAQQVQIDEISEAGLIFKYHRTLEVGSFRRFYLWTPNEFELRDYHANCNYFEQVKDGKTVFYIHHYVFFGMTDFYLKNIRLWVRENYIQSKSKD